MSEQEKIEQVKASYLVAPNTIQNMTLLSLRHGISRTEEARICGSTLISVQEDLDSGSEFLQLLPNGDQIPLNIHGQSEDVTIVDFSSSTTRDDVVLLSFWASKEYDEHMKGLAEKYGLSESDVFSLSVDLRMRMEQLIDSGGEVLVKNEEGELAYYRFIHQRNPKMTADDKV